MDGDLPLPAGQPFQPFINQPGEDPDEDPGDKADHHRDEGDGAHDVVSLGVEDGVVRDGADHADAVALDEDGVGEIGARPLRLRVQGEGGKAAARMLVPAGSIRTATNP